MDEGQEYSSSNWPLHVTIADTFAIDGDLPGLITELVTMSKKYKPISVTAPHEEHFGPEQQVKVTILDMNNKLIRLHYDVIEVLKSLGARFNDPQFIEKGFRPHATVQPHARVDVGGTIIINNLTIIDMFPANNPYKRKVLKIINLLN